jgi:hypothetical protein
MTIKVTYNTTDIYVSESISATYINVSYEVPSDGGGAVWGDITGTLSDQTDLQNALNAKFDDPTGTTAQYLRGDGTLATFPTITSGTVTSVGLTMPTAFSVTNSPVTSSGTLAVTGAGTAAQYIRGDGQLANFPDNQGGGSSVNYYLNGSVTQGTFGGDTYYEMSKTPVLGAGTNFTRTNAQGNGYIASFITDAGDPSLLNIPAGNWNVEFYFQANSNAGNPQFYAELYKVDASNNFTLVGSGSTNPEGITNGTTVDQYYTAIPVPQTSLLVTDRLAIRIYVITSGRTITLHTENSNLCEVITTLSTGLNALNSLTAQVQYFATGTSGTDFAISSATDTHTFNLPTASATNRGALSSADWTTFNSKQNALTNPITGSGASGQVAYFTGATTQAGSNNLFWDNTNVQLAIGTNTFFSTEKLLVSSNSPTGNTVLRISNTGTTTNTQSLVTFTLNTNSTAATTAAIGGNATDTSGNTALLFYTSASASAAVRMQLRSTGNLIIQNGGTFTDSGQRLQVTGDTLLKGSGNTSATTALTVQNSDGTAFFYVQNGGFTYNRSRLYIGGPSTTNSLRPSGTLNREGFEFASSCFGTDTTSDFRFVSGQGAATTITTGTKFTLSVESPGFSPTSGTGVYTLVNLSTNINQTGGANGITRGLYVNPTLTAAADWRSIEWSNNTGWGLYGAGTSNNYLNGNLLIGSTTSSGEKLQVTGTAKITGASSFGGNMTLTINQNGNTNFLIANTTAGTSAQSTIQLQTSAGSGSIGKYSGLTTAYKFVAERDFFLYNTNTGGDIAFLNDFATGNIKFGAGGSSTAQMTIKSNGRINMSSLPTSATGLSAGDLWNDGGTLKIV